MEIILIRVMQSNVRESFQMSAAEFLIGTQYLCEIQKFQNDSKMNLVRICQAKKPHMSRA